MLQFIGYSIALTKVCFAKRSGIPSISLTSQLGMFGETREFMQETNKKLRKAFTDEHMGQVRDSEALRSSTDH